jgi:hypothetical protein
MYFFDIDSHQFEYLLTLDFQAAFDKENFIIYIKDILKKIKINAAF